MKNNKKGFSLIELSIVLIIIGLLVAGITGGASLIKSAELRSAMSDIRNYQTAVNAYYTATGELPGAAGSSSIPFANSCSAWAALVNEGIVDAKLSSFTGTTTYVCAALGASSAVYDSANSIASKYKGAYYALGYNTQMESNVIFMIGTGTTKDSPNNLTNAKNVATVANVTNPSLTRKDAKFLDDKMDNGIIDSGRIFGFTGSTGATMTCAYDNTTTKDCAIAIGFGI